jgi:hypothetical protein
MIREAYQFKSRLITNPKKVKTIASLHAMNMFPFDVETAEPFDMCSVVHKPEQMSIKHRARNYIVREEVPSRYCLISSNKDG